MPARKRNVQDLTLIQLRAIKTKRAKLEGRVNELDARVNALEWWVFKGKLPKAGK